MRVLPLVHSAFFLDTETKAVALFIRFNKGFVPVLHFALTARVLVIGELEAFFHPQTTYADFSATHVSGFASSCPSTNHFKVFDERSGV